MALEKISIIDQIEVVGDYAVQVRETVKVMDSGVQIGGDSYHRHTIDPSMDWSNEDVKVKKICDALFDADCKEAWQLDQHGYPSGDPSDSWTKAQLQKYCADRSIAMDLDAEGVTTHTKAELLAKITEYNDNLNNPE